MMWYWRQYLWNADDGENPYASPLRAESLAGLPPAYVVTAGFDPLRDEGEAYAAALDAAGVPVVLRRYPGAINGFLRAPRTLVAGRRAIAEIGRALRT
jgi:acetyl esterase